jgi:hypothetical protein
MAMLWLQITDPAFGNGGLWMIVKKLQVKTGIHAFRVEVFLHGLNGGETLLQLKQLFFQLIHYWIDKSVAAN